MEMTVPGVRSTEIDTASFMATVNRRREMETLQITGIRLFRIKTWLDIRIFGNEAPCTEVACARSEIGEREMVEMDIGIQ
ncbi:hypothetical protein SK128_024593, partial [Halocaridina rubra]